MRVNAQTAGVSYKAAPRGGRATKTNSRPTALEGKHNSFALCLLPGHPHALPERLALSGTMLPNGVRTVCSRTGLDTSGPASSRTSDLARISARNAENWSRHCRASKRIWIPKSASISRVSVSMSKSPASGCSATLGAILPRCCASKSEKPWV